MNRMKMAAVAMMAAACCFTALSAFADDRKEEKNSGDKEFAQKASACGLAEVNLSNLAKARSGNADIQRFAQHMVVNHTKANNELITLANARSMPLARTMDKKHQELFDKLAKLDGREFDAAYIEGMVKDHEEAVKLFEKESKDGGDDGLKTWAGNTLPNLKHHLDAAKTICDNTKGKKEKEKGASDR